MELAQNKSRIVLLVLMMIVIFMEFLDMTIVNTSIPSIARSFSVPPMSIKFAVVSYFLGLGIFIPISGWCVDKFGYKTVFVLSLFLFALASWSCAKSHNVEELTIFRFLQGVGGAYMNPVARIMMVRAYPAEKLVKIQGVIFTPAILGIVFGPFLGGALSQYASWQWIFYINIPLSILAIILGLIYIDKNEIKISNRLDIIGFILSGMAISGLTIFIESVNHYELFPKQIVFLLGAIGVLALFILYYHCKSSSNAIFNLNVLKINTISLSFLINLLIYSLNSGIVFLLPLMYQEVFHFSPYKSGALIVPISMGYFLARLFSNRIIHKFGFKKVVFYSTGIICLAVLLISLIQINTSILVIILFESLFGASFVFANSSTSALIYCGVSKKLATEVTTLDLVTKHFSTSLGIGISSFILMLIGMNIGQHSLGLKEFHYTYMIIAVLPFFATLISSQIRVNLI